YKHVNEPPPQLAEIDPTRPEALETIVQKALAKRPEDRYQTAGAMAAALRAVPVDQPSQIRSAVGPGVPPVPTPAPIKPRRSIWKAALALGTVGLLFVAILAGGAYYYLNSGSLPLAVGMVPVQGGNYQLGQGASNSETYAASRTVRLDDFWIDQYEVTNADYAQYVAAEDGELPASWNGAAVPAGREEYPVAGVTMEAAEDYCDWLDKRLPTEAEWEAAARGLEARLYPWGEDAAAVELPRADTYPVGNILANRSRNNVFDMAGNVWEWVIDPYEQVPNGEAILRGGQYGLVRDAAYRLVGDPESGSFYANAGIRCAADEVADPPNANVLYEDDFTDINRGWPTEAQDAALFGYHPPDFYHVEVSQPQQSVVAFRGLDEGDFTAEADIVVDHTTSTDGDFYYGLAFRRSEAGFYAFTISSRTDRWQLFRQDGTERAELASGSMDEMGGLIRLDRMRVDVSGAQITVGLNGIVVAQVEDDTLTQGDVGFFVQTLDEPLAHVHFDYLVIRPYSDAGWQQ
ncbi:MAG: SUMF1/EgtB/PvdO family nonheme iron enzyme, partial [Anaerolineales bacterium]|nr:SUMF1/EgtB/PvdO family nonheme iron enzyme [Anaerolineales bacterium]